MSEIYNIYLESIFSLSKSIVLKSVATETIMNHYDSSRMEVSDDPTTWRYYQNLNGQYHILDVPMYVTSADTKETILFDKDILVSHPLTRTEYGPKGNLRGELLERFPDNEELIDRILNPIDIDKAIAAKDFEILYYNKSLLDSNEHSLMIKLQSWIYNFTHRWNIPEMGLTDPLYPAVFIGVLYIYLTVEIVNLRLKNVFTPEASQWHIWQYLSSNLGLGKFKDALDVESSLYLYKNISYIRDNIGKERLLSILDKKLLAPLGLLTERVDMVRFESYSDIDGVTISSLFNKVHIDDPGTDIKAGRLLDSGDIIEKTISVAPDNSKIRNQVKDKLETGIIGRKSNSKNTNLILISEEANIISAFSNIEQLRLDYWVYLASQGRFEDSMTISVPGRGILNLSPLNTFILLLFATSNITNTPLTEIPLIGLPKVIDIVPYDYDMIMSVCNRDDVDVELLRAAYIEGDVELPMLNSVQGLFDFVDDLVVMNYSHITAKSSVKTINGFGQYAAANDRHYIYKEVRLAADNTLYSDWLESIELITTGLTVEDWVSVIDSCLLAGTGKSDDQIGLSNRHILMVELMTKLTSYATTILPGESFSSADLLEVGGVEYSLIDSMSNRDVASPIIGVTTFKHDTTFNAYTEIEIASVDFAFDAITDVEINVDLGIRSDPVHEFNISIYAPSTGVVSVVTIEENP